MVLLVNGKRSPSEAEPTEFGWLLQLLMRKRRIKTATALSVSLKGDGYPISQQMISRYINGQSKVPLGFVSQIIKTLGLDEGDQSALSNRWAETLPEEERAVIMRVWETRRTAAENIKAAEGIEAESAERARLGKAEGMVAEEPENYET